jgi:TRAP-type C4-dicarboxylate transport system permease small subunit
MDHLEQILATLCTSVMVILLTLQVVTRYAFHRSFTWTEEIATILFIWSIFFACSAAVVKGKHIKIDAVLSRLSFKKAKALKLFNNAVFFFFCVVMIFAFVPVIEKLLSSHALTALTRIPQSFIYSILPLCLLLTAFRLAQDSIRVFRRKEGESDGNTAMIHFDELT